MARRWRRYRRRSVLAVRRNTGPSRPARGCLPSHVLRRPACFLGRDAIGSPAALYSLDEAAAVGGDLDSAPPFELPLWAQPPIAAGGAPPLPYPRCINGGSALAFVSASGVVVTVDSSTGGVTALGGSDTGRDSAGSSCYSDATALAPVGMGLCFSGLTDTGRVLLCAPHATGGVLTAGSGVTLPDSLPWALSAGGRAWVPCYSAAGSGPHPCAFHPPSGVWALNTAVLTPYSSFSEVAGSVYFAGSWVGETGIGLWRTPAYTPLGL